jgi:LysM domain
MLSKEGSLIKFYAFFNKSKLKSLVCRKRNMTRVRNVLCVVILFNLMPFSWANEAENEATQDLHFEQRLTTVTTYTTHSGDSLRRIAYFLYGHKSWWSKIKDDNPTLQTYDPDDPLPEKLQVRYRAPKLGATYVVQPNDWLIRIVQWKYGATDRWEEIYHKNSQKISNPNLIHPGDQLILDLNGTVRRAVSGEVLIEGVPSATTTPQPSATVTESVESNSALFWIGFLIGIIFLLLIPVLVWWIRKGSGVASLHLQPPRLKKLPKKKPALLPPRKKPSAFEYPYAFNRRSAEKMDMDRSLIHRDGGDIDNGPNYHTISKKKNNK